MVQGGVSRISAIVVCLGISALCFALCIYSGLYERRVFSSNRTKYLSGAYIPHADVFTSADNTAYYFLALGSQAHQLNCPAAIESLVKIAGWNGHVYLISDETDCFDRKQIVEYAGMNSSKFHLINVGSSNFKGGVTLSGNPKLMFRKGRMQSKAMKARIFDYIDDLSIEIAVFADCDVLFGIPGCAADLARSGEAWEKGINIKFGKVYRDVNYSAFHSVHTGFFVAHRQYSKTALNLWSAELNTFEHDMDFLAYSAAYNASSSITPNPMEPERILCNYCRGLEWESFIRLEGSTHTSVLPLPSKPINEDLSCINHISKARCLKYGRNAVQAYVNRFRLRSYDKALYCVDPLLHPLLYGPVPLNSLPGCIKVENIF